MGVVVVRKKTGHRVGRDRLYAIATGGVLVGKVLLPEKLGGRLVEYAPGRVGNLRLLSKLTNIQRNVLQTLPTYLLEL